MFQMEDLEHKIGTVKKIPWESCITATVHERENISSLILLPLSTNIKSDLNALRLVDRGSTSQYKGIL